MSTFLGAFHEYTHLGAELQNSGHSKWGFVIYRCTYSSDDDWNKMMDYIKKRDLNPDEQPSWDALDRNIRGGLVFTVFEDGDLLDGASKETVLRQFTQWVDSEPWHEEQPPGCRQAGSARYEICLMVDKTSLQSILNQPKGFFPPNIGEWEGEEEQAGFVYALRYKGTKVSAGDGNVEKCWVRLSCNFLTLRWYTLLRSGGWYNEYRQHPDIAVGEPWKTEQPSESAGISARYDICIWIDETSLKSILNEPENYVAPEPGTWTKEEEDLVGWVYALRYYKKPLPGAEREWMRITFSDLMTRWYILLRTDGWHHEYRQHPDIAVG